MLNHDALGADDQPLLVQVVASRIGHVGVALGGQDVASAHVGRRGHCFASTGAVPIGSERLPLRVWKRAVLVDQPNHRASLMGQEVELLVVQRIGIVAVFARVRRLVVDFITEVPKRTVKLL